MPSQIACALYYSSTIVLVYWPSGSRTVDTLNSALQVLGITILAASVIEAAVLFVVTKGAYDWRSSLASFGVLVGRGITEGVPIAIAMPGAYWLYEHRLLDTAALGAWSYLLLFAGLEFVYYWWHRISHRSRWFWANHAVHHSPNSFNLSAAYRVGWTARIMATYVIFAPLVWLGFSPPLVFVAYSLNLAYQFWIHAEWIPKLGSLEGILNTPSAHRVHHATNLDYLDANYGGVLLIFDRLFGTYRAERDNVPIRYGLVTPLYSNNPFKIAFHQFGPLFRDLLSSRSAREVVGYLFGPPGWRPDGNGTTTEDLRRKAVSN
jgi:sterol desaturase/sphingolipid hydroxylase (fatty acid hydroxylase superfamily)